MSTSTSFSPRLEALLARPWLEPAEVAEVKELAEIAGRRIIICGYDLRNPQAGWQIVDVAGPRPADA